MSYAAMLSKIMRMPKSPVPLGLPRYTTREKLGASTTANLVKHMLMVGLEPIKSIAALITTRFDPFDPVSPSAVGAARIYKMCHEVAEKMNYKLPQDCFIRDHGIEITAGTFETKGVSRLIINEMFLMSKENLPKYLDVDFDSNDPQLRQNWIRGYESIVHWKKHYKSQFEMDYKRGMYGIMFDYYRNPELHDKVLRGIIAHEISHMKNRDYVVKPAMSLALTVANFTLNPLPLIGMIPVYLINMKISRMIETRCDRDAKLSVGGEGLVRFFTDINNMSRGLLEKYPEYKPNAVDDLLSQYTGTHTPTKQRIADLGA